MQRNLISVSLFVIALTFAIEAILPAGSMAIAESPVAVAGPQQRADASVVIEQAPKSPRKIRWQPITQFSALPSDSTITFFGFGGSAGFFDEWTAFLAANGITSVTWDGSQYASNNLPLGMEYLWPGSDTSSQTAPYGVKLMASACRFVFAQPIYAVGGTFFSTQDANAPIGASTVYAYDQSGNVIGAVRSSSLTEENGPHLDLVDIAGRPLVASWAGVWSSTPIYAVEFTGVRTDSMYMGANQTAFASFAFSRTPLPPGRRK